MLIYSFDMFAEFPDSIAVFSVLPKSPEAPNLLDLGMLFRLLAKARELSLIIDISHSL